MKRLIVLQAATASLALLLLPGCSSPSAGDNAAAANEIPQAEIKGLNFAGLSDAQAANAVSVLNSEGCPCGCGMNMAKCRRDDSTCRTSLGLGSQIVALARQGRTGPQIVASVRNQGQQANRAQAAKAQPQKAPAKYVQFPIPVGNAPFVGPKNAKVTILHYLDYQ